jgi:hypothetical protein
MSQALKLLVNNRNEIPILHNICLNNTPIELPVYLLSRSVRHLWKTMLHLPCISAHPMVRQMFKTLTFQKTENCWVLVRNFTVCFHQRAHPNVTSSGTNKVGAQFSSRHAPGRSSNASSDLETSVGPRPQKGQSAAKKRKVGKDADVKGEWDSTTQHGTSTKSKGKGKAAREKSPDSVSTATKGSRKKALPKKKLAIPPDTLDALGLASASASASADMTPNTSRPPSPTMSSSIFYELDQTIPPLKRAKKIDDAAMLKRMRTLEEAQRKAWYNIARRDVAKVCHCIYPCCIHLTNAI